MTFSQATITQTIVSNFFLNMEGLGYTDTAILKQVRALSDQHRTDDKAFIAALQQALKDAEQQESYRVIEKAAM